MSGNNLATVYTNAALALNSKSLSAIQASYTDRQTLNEALQAATQFEQLKLSEAEWAQAREEQGWLNFLVGALVVAGGVLCIVATAGMATPFVVAGAVAGMATIGYGASNMIEAGQDIIYGAMGNYSAVAFNPLRDTLFMGNQKAYDTFGTVAQMSCAVVTFGGSAYTNAAAAVGQASNAGACTLGQVLAGGKAVGEVAVKSGITMIAATGGGYMGSGIGKGAAKLFGASETVTEIFGLIGGAAGSMSVGAATGEALKNWKWHYEPGNGLPDGVCFVAGTPVLTVLGNIAIEQISVGDTVISTDTETGETAAKRVLETYIRKSDSLVHVWVEGQETKVTVEHPYYVLGKGWVKAGILAAGDRLRTPDGESVIVQDSWIETLEEPVTVYNLKVDEFHTYYAGIVSVLVHNADYQGQNYDDQEPLSDWPENGDTGSTRDTDGGTGNGLPEINGTSYDVNKLYKTQPENWLDRRNVSNIKDAIQSRGPGAVDPIPIRVQNDQALVLDGHHRLQAFIELGYDRVPIKYVQWKPNY